MHSLRRHLLPTLLLLSAALPLGCGSASEPASVPTSDVKLAASEPSSQLAALGVEVSLTPPIADGERWLGTLDAKLASCVKPGLEREPWLQGRMTFKLEPASPNEAPSTLKATSVRGELAYHAAGSCLQQAFTSNPPPSNLSSALHVELNFRGGYEAAALGAEPALEQRLVGLDWNSDERVEPPGARTTIEAAAERLRRCAYGAEPKLRTPAWFAVRVTTGGKAEAKLASYRERSPASDCAERLLNSLALPDVGHDYALSLMLLPPKELGALEDGETGLAAQEQETLPSMGPKVVLGPLEVRGKLPPEVIQRIVGQRLPQFRECYATGLTRDPQAEGLVTVKFVIGKDGAIGKLSSLSEIKDSLLSLCVQNAFEKLTFPAPEAGIAIVAYPVKLYSGKKAVPRLAAINDKPVEQASMAELTTQLVRRGLQFVEVPGFASSQTPAVFVRDQQDVAHGAFFGKPSTKPKTTVCTQGSPERMLQLFGEGCAPLLDLMVR